MSDFKFACPVCGQHITCDSSTSGAQMDCPTCFRKLVIPQKPTENSSNLILTAALVGAQRPTSQVGDTTIARPTKSFPIAAIVLVVAIGATAAGAYVFRDKLFKPRGGEADASTTSSNTQAQANIPKVIRPANDTNWMLNLADVKFPETRATGWVDGKYFQLQRATVQGGTITLRQKSGDPQDLRVVINLFAKAGEDLAGQTINIETNRENPPRLSFRFKDEQQQQARRDIREGYALKIEFGAVANNRLPAKIYLATPDDAKSWVAGTFDAEIRKPAPPKKPKTTNAPAATTPKR